MPCTPMEGDAFAFADQACVDRRLPNYDPQLKARLQAESMTPLAVPVARIGSRPRPASAAGVRGTRPHSRPGLYKLGVFHTACSPATRALGGLSALKAMNATL